MLGFQPVTKHIFRLELRFFSVDLPDWMKKLCSLPVNVWLVWDMKGWTLIDTGPPETADLLVRAVLETTRGACPYRVLLTHGHYDHAGGLPAVRVAWNPEVHCHRFEMPFIMGEKDYTHLRSPDPRYSLGRFIMEPLTWAVRRAYELFDNDQIAGLRVIHLPGHTPGHVAYLHLEDRALICGDTLMNLKKISGPFRLFTQQPGQARRSVLRLVQQNFAHLLPSHGAPVMKLGRRAVLAYIDSHYKSRKRSRIQMLLDHMRARLPT